MHFILTIVGILIYAVARGLNSLLGVDTSVFLIIGMIPALIGVVISLIKGDKLKGKLIEVAIHVGIWVIGYLIITFLLSAIILVVIILLIDHFILGGVIRTWIMNKFAGAQGDGSVIWPTFVYDDSNNQFVLVKTYGDCADYVCEAYDWKFTVSTTDVGENTMSTLYGTLHW